MNPKFIKTTIMVRLFDFDQWGEWFPIFARKKNSSDGMWVEKSSYQKLIQFHSMCVVWLASLIKLTKESKQHSTYSRRPQNPTIPVTQESITRVHKAVGYCHFPQPFLAMIKFFKKLEVPWDDHCLACWCALHCTYTWFVLQLPFWTIYYRTENSWFYNTIRLPYRNVSLSTVRYGAVRY